MKKNSKGQAMLIVIGIMALLTTLSLVVLLAASTMMGSSRRNAISTRCRMAAVSFSNMFGNALKDDDFTNGSPGKVIAQMIQEDAEGNDGSNGKFSYCAGREEDHFSWSYVPKFEKGQEGILTGYSIDITMWWGEEDEKTLDEIKLQINSGENPFEQYNGLYLYTRVSCSNGKESWNIIQSYPIHVEKDSEDDTAEWIWRFY